MADEATRRVVSEIPVLKTNAGPRDRELWVQRLKEEYQSLIRVSLLLRRRSAAGSLCARNGLRAAAFPVSEAKPQIHRQVSCG